MKIVPDISFKGFEKEWKKKQIGEIGYTYSGLTGKTKSDFGIGDCLYITFLNVLNNAIINSSILEKVNVCIDEKQNKVCKGDILFNTSSETPEELGMCAAVDEELIDVYLNSFCFGLRITDKEIDSLFFAYLMRSDIGRNIMKFLAQGATRYNLSKNNFYKTKLLLPETKAEQYQIASYFRQLDIQISEQEKRIVKLKQLKSACLISMFPQQGETVPRVRFKGFDGEWKNIKLKDILVERHEMSTITFLLPQLSFTISEGVIKPENRKTNKRDFLIKDKKNKKYIVTKIGDIIYNPANVVFGAIHRNNLCDGVVSPIYKIFYSEEDTKFVECIVRNPAFINKLTLYTEGTVTKLKTLKPESFLDMEVCITNDKAEQHQIASYFRNLDIQISEQEKRLEKLKQIKAACLDKMFV